MLTVLNSNIALESEMDYMPNEALIERLQALKATVDIVEDKKAKKRIYGEIKYLENLVLEKEINCER